MKIAIVGSGYWGKNHIRCLKEILLEGKFEELCICDKDEFRARPQLRRRLREDVNISYYTDHTKIPRDVDGVVIGTPSDTHYSIAEYFLTLGKDVLVEKPMTLHSKDAEKLIRIAEKSGNILMVGHIFRYHSAVKEIKNKIEKGDFGAIYYIMSNRFSLRHPREDMGVLFALGIHEVDVFCYLLNKKYPEEIFAAIESYVGKTEETAQIIAYFEGNARGYAFESWLTPVYGKRRELVVVGNRLSAFVNYLRPNEITFFDAFISPETVVNEGSYVLPIEYKEPLKEELYDFIDCMKTREKPVADMYVGKRAVEMIEKALISAREGMKVRFG